MASATKYKSLALKLYSSIEDLKGIMKSQSTWRKDEINRLVMQNAKHRDSLGFAEENNRLRRKMDFQRAITITDGKTLKNVNTPKHDKSSKHQVINEVQSDDDSIEMKGEDEQVSYEERILTELFRTSVI